MINDLSQNAAQLVDESFFTSLTIQKLIPALLSMIVGIVLVRLFLKLLDRGLNRTKMANKLYGFMRSILKILLYTIVALISLSSLGYNMSSLVAVLSVVSLALSLAIQGVLANVAGGIQVLTAHPFSVGDYIQIGGNEGFVTDIGMIYSTIKTRQGQLIYLPNNEVSNTQIINHSALGKRRIDLDVNVSYDSPCDGVRAALLAAAQVEGVIPEPAPYVKVVSYDDSSIHYIMEVWCNPPEYWDVHARVTEQVRTEFNKTGMILTYPHLNVHIDK